MSAFRSFSQSSSIATSEPAGKWRCCPDRSCCRGVGSLAVHLAKLRGAPVIVLASEFEFDLVRGLGAHVQLPRGMEKWKAKSASHFSLTPDCGRRVSPPFARRCAEPDGEEMMAHVNQTRISCDRYLAFDALIVKK